MSQADECEGERSGVGGFLLRDSGEWWAMSRCRHRQKYLFTFFF